MTEEDKIQDISSKIFAILFVKNEPTKIAKLAKSVNAKKEDTEKALDYLNKKLNEKWSGIMIIEKNDEVFLSTKPDIADTIENIIKLELKQDLTKAALETLSIIAYFSPISRSKIDYIRGVNSTYILRSLLMRGLVERKMERGHYIYEPSFDLLRYLGVSKVEELPNYEEKRSLMDKIFVNNFQVEERTIKMESNNEN